MNHQTPHKAGGTRSKRSIKSNAIRPRVRRVAIQCCMKTKILITTITTLIAFSIAPASFAAEVVKTEDSAAASATADARFMENVTRDNLMEIKAAEIAADKTKRDNVKDFAKSIEKDHTDVNKNLKSLADRMEMKMPPSGVGEISGR